jgi:hypothetical protein
LLSVSNRALRSTPYDAAAMVEAESADHEPEKSLLNDFEALGALDKI